MHDGLKARPLVGLGTWLDGAGLSLSHCGRRMAVLDDWALARELTAEKHDGVFVYNRCLAPPQRGHTRPGERGRGNGWDPGVRTWVAVTISWCRFPQAERLSASTR